MSYLPILAWMASVLAITLIITAVAPRLVELLGESRLALASFAHRIVMAASGFLRPRVEAFWQMIQGEPKSALVCELAGIADSLPDAGNRTVQRLRALEKRIAADFRGIAELPQLDIRTSQELIASIEKDSRSRSGGWPTIIVYLLIALLVGGANVLLLNQFFAEFMGSTPVLPGLLPDLHYSHLLAFVFFAFEVAIGFLLHHMSKNDEDGQTARVMALVPWIGLAGLVVMEAMAYSLLSSTIDLPSRFGMDPSHPLFNLAKYFMATFGVGITLVLAAMGYVIGRAFTNLGEVRQHKKLLAGLRSYARVVEATTEHATETQQRLAVLRTEAESFRPKLVSDFKAMIGAGTGESLAQILESALPQMGSSMGGYDEPPKPVRTKRQAIVDILLYATMAVVGAAVIVWSLDYLHMVVIARLRSQAQGTTAWLLASAATLTAIAAGFFMRSVVRTRRPTSVVPTIMPGLAGKITAAVLAIVAVSILATLAVTYGTLGGSTLLNVLLGITHATILMVIGGVADEAIAGIWEMLRLLAFAVVRAFSWAAAGALLAVSALLAVIEFAVRWTSAFGRLILRSPRFALTPARAA